MTKPEGFIQELLRIYAIVFRNMEGSIFSELDIQNKVEEVSSVFKLVCN